MQRRTMLQTILAAGLWGASTLGLMTAAHAQDGKTLSIGYWTSGFSLGFGAVLEQGGFLEDEGITPEFRRFSEVSAPAQGVLTGDVDVAFAAPAAAAFNLGRQGVPVRAILVTQILEGSIMVPADSPIQSVEDLAGKRVGMSRAGSSTHALVTTIFDQNFGLPVSDYSIVPGNEGQLMQLLTRGDIDASSLRSVTIAQMPQENFRPIMRIVDEWQTLTENDVPPALAVALTRKDLVEEDVETLAAFIRATQKAVKFGAENPDEVAEILQQVANLDAEAAQNYASVWESAYMASFTPADIEALKRENQIFVEAGAAEGVAPDELYASEPFEAATQE